jgi:hypothetical protein
VEAVVAKLRARHRQRRERTREVSEPAKLRQGDGQHEERCDARGGRAHCDCAQGQVLAAYEDEGTDEQEDAPGEPVESAREERRTRPEARLERRAPRRSFGELDQGRKREEHRKDRGELEDRDIHRNKR